MALNFMIHAGGAQVEREAIAKVAVPEITKTYCPIPHEDFANLIQDNLESAGFKYGEEAHALAKDGGRYFGMAELRNGNNPDDFALVAGWRSSYDKSFPASFVVGSQVFVCDNLAFSGEIKIGRRHTSNIMKELPFLIWEAVQKTKSMQAAQVERFEHYKEQKLTDQQANDLIIQLFREGVMASCHLGKVVNEYYEPSHEEFLENGRSAWTLFNAATEALKGSNLFVLPQRTQKMHNVIDAASEFKGLELEAA